MTNEPTPRTAHRAPALALLLAAAVLAGCSSSHSADATPDASAGCPVIGAGTSQFTFGAAACDTCMSTSCCTQVTACMTGVVSGGHPCADLLSCISACVVAGGVQADCTISCATQHPAGIAAGTTLQTCLMTSCSASCPQ
jgi:hypothetical protein